VLRRVLGTLLVTFGTTTVVLALAACAWIYGNVSATQFDLRPVWVGGGIAVALGGMVIVGGLRVLVRQP
jgi:hypothetical protein